MIKRIFLGCALMMLLPLLWAQRTTNITFEGKDQYANYVRLDRVMIENLTHRWQDMLFYPDTVLHLGQTGISNYAEQAADLLSPNRPNPFDGVTEVVLTPEATGMVTLKVTDMAGRCVVSRQWSSLPAGSHLLRLSLASPQIYLLTATQNGHTATVKMANTGYAGINHISYVGLIEGGIDPALLRSAPPMPFAIGDQMTYTGYATVLGKEYQADKNTTLLLNGKEQLIFTLPYPSVFTAAASDVEAYRATLLGSLLSDGGMEVTSRGFFYGTTANPYTQTVEAEANEGRNDFSAVVSDLEPGTSYTFKAYATNAIGTAYGSEKQFMTPTVLPTVTTDSIGEVGSHTVDVAATVVADGGATVTARGVCYSTSQNPTVAGSYTTDGDGIGNYTSHLTNLQGNTTYYVRAYATNSVGTAYGTQRGLTTQMGTPTVTLGEVTSITDISATCSGYVVADGGAAVTARGVCWSTSPNPTINNNKTTNGTGTGSFTSSITGLIAGTTYYVRAYATNSAGTSYGEEKSFTTLALPKVTTNTITNITTTTATCGGNVTSDGGAAVTARGVCWSTSPNPTINNNKTTNGTGTGSFTSSITGLIAGTTYYVRAYATNSVGTSYGVEVSFTTLNVPTITTSAVTDITVTTATCGGDVTSDAGAAVTARGVCWSTSPNPTTSNSKTTNGTGIGSFTSSLTGLTSGTTYYVRAYATNSVGTAYGEEKSFTTLNVPTITTNAVTDITATTATCGGNVTSDGGSAITARGVCWSTSSNPTISNNKNTNGSGTGSFTSNLKNLTKGVTYYIRAYATNSIGTAYGNEVSFSTIPDGQPCPGAATLTDCDGNTYNTILLGHQCWMKENLKTTKYADGTSILQGSSTYTTTPYWSYPNNDAANKVTYGLLYNWKAVMRNSSSSSANPSGVQGICPTGWHVPSTSEWKQLASYVGSQSIYLCSGNYIAKALASTTGWTSSTYSCAPGKNQASNNATGFSALPAGSGNGGFGTSALFWSATQSNESYSCDFELSYGSSYYSNDTEISGIYFSLRCLRNVLPSVTTLDVTNITATSAVCGGDVSSIGVSEVTARGVCWSTSPDPTIADNHTTNGSGMGSYSSRITGLTAGTIYYVRTYATNCEGTGYGEEKSFITTPVLIDCGLVTDYDKNVYNTIQIGNQCWMRENLRTTKYADGTSIEQGTSTSTTVAYWYCPNNDDSNISVYGLLYNWKAVMRNLSSSETNPSNVQGICPTGWHVPSDAEWTQLTDYVSSQSQFRCNGTSSIGKALASNIGWDSSLQRCAVGNNPSANNATGFGALPAGYYYYNGSIYDGFSKHAQYWSATEYGSNRAYQRSFSYNSDGVVRSGSNYTGLSVRCVKD